MKKLAAITTAALTALTLTACGTTDTPTPSSSSKPTSSTTESSPESESSSAAPRPNPTHEQTTETTPTPSDSETTSTQPTGYTEAPGQVEPTEMNKTIASCGDPALHETGTTFFTDGTSGWTQQCADQMMPQQPAGAPEPAPSAYYPNCDVARAAGAAPLYAGDPGYSSDLDGDGDGIACE